MTVNVDMDDAEPHLSQLLEQVAAGESVIISKGGEPIADLVPHQRKKVLFGAMKGEFTYDDSIFDGPDPDIEAMFRGSDGKFDDDAPAR